MNSRVLVRILPLIAFHVLASASFVAAQRGDVVGIYFDAEGTFNAWQTSMAPEAVNFWVVVKDMSATNGLGGVSMMGVSDRDLCGQTLIGPMDFGPCDNLWAFVADPPLPRAGSIAVVHGAVLVADTQERIELYLQPYDDGMVSTSEVFYWPAGGGVDDAIVLNPPSGTFDEPLATINGIALPVNGSSWGRVKALFR